MTAVFERQLHLELFEGPSLVAAGQENQPQKPVKCHRAEARFASTSPDLRHCEPGRQLALGLVERLPCHVHGGGKPVRLRKIWQQGKRAMGRAKALLAPTRVRQPEMMTPIIRL